MCHVFCLYPHFHIWYFRAFIKNSTEKFGSEHEAMNVNMLTHSWQLHYDCRKKTNCRWDVLSYQWNLFTLVKRLKNDTFFIFKGTTFFTQIKIGTQSWCKKIRITSWLKDIRQIFRPWIRVQSAFKNGWNSSSET